jgi:hypothetical protein
MWKPEINMKRPPCTMLEKKGRFYVINELLNSDANIKAKDYRVEAPVM